MGHRNRNLVGVAELDVGGMMRRAFEVDVPGMRSLPAAMKIAAALN